MKGSPGVTSVALALAAVWPRPVVLLEADPAGSDLAFRCRAATGGAISPHRGLIRLAAAVRVGAAAPTAVADQAQLLACGVNLVQGVSTAAQARGVSGMWATLAEACLVSETDVIADLGRLDRRSPTMPMARAATVLMTVASASLESVMHLADGLHDVLGGLAQSQGAVNAHPVLVGADAHAARDCADLDDLLTRAGLPVAPTRPVAYDRKALDRLAAGEKAGGRLGRTLLIRTVRMLATSVAPGASAALSEAGVGVDGSRTGVDR